MTIAEPDDAGKQSLSHLIDALGNASWSVRQAAVDRLVKVNSPQLLAALLDIIRDSNRDLPRLNAAIQVLANAEYDVIPALLDLMNHANPDVREYVALALGLRGDIRAIGTLVNALSDTNANVQIHSIEALGKLRATAAVDRLIDFISSGFELAFPALDALKTIGDERIAFHLVPLLKNSLLQGAAIEALGALGGEEFIIPLLDLFGDSAVSRGAIAQAILQIHERQERRYAAGEAIECIVRQSRDAVSAFCSAIAESSSPENAAIVPLLGWCGDKASESTLLDCLATSELRLLAMEALAARGSSITPALLQRLEGASIETQRDLIELCGRVGDRRSVSTVLTCLSRGDEPLQLRALEACARIGDPQFYGAAISLLGHTSPRIRQAAVGVLNSLGHPAAANDMLRLLHDPSALVRDSAIRVAAYFGFPVCIDSLLDCCDDPDDRVRRTAIEHLPCLEDARVVPRLEQAMRAGNAAIRAAAAGATGELDSDIAVPLLRDALNDPDVWVRYFAVRGLAKVGQGTEVVQQLRMSASNEQAMQVRIAAVEALGVDAISDLATMASSPDDDLAAAALSALGRTRHSDSLPALIAAAVSADPRRQLEGIRALGEAGLVGAVEVLQQAAEGQNQPLAAEAITALGRIATSESVESLLRILSIPSKRPAAMNALEHLGEAAVPVLACRLQSQAVDVRRAVVEVLIEIRSLEAVDLLETALGDSEPGVRSLALSALAQLRSSITSTSGYIGSKGDA